jgi:hypothetical protein
LSQVSTLVGDHGGTLGVVRIPLSFDSFYIRNPSNEVPAAMSHVFSSNGRGKIREKERGKKPRGRGTREKLDPSLSFSCTFFLVVLCPSSFPFLALLEFLCLHGVEFILYGSTNNGGEAREQSQGLHREAAAASALFLLLFLLHQRQWQR